MYFDIKKWIYNGQFELALISTTAKHSTDFLRLPDRIINGKRTINLLISKEKVAQEVFHIIDGQVPSVLIDVEQKQSINLFDIAKKIFIKSQVFPYKPNDITIESADQLILNHFFYDVRSKNILICGTGNISTKLSIRLAERQASVFIAGRNSRKVEQIVKGINMILPPFTDQPVQELKEHKDFNSFDSLVSFISAEKIIDESMVDLLKPDGIAIDGGIGNFTEGFISRALTKNVKTLRLDVRGGLPFIEANLLSMEHPFYEDVSGETTYEGIKVVAGGIIGPTGSVIIDRINNPTQVIGIANGIGGVKSETDLTNSEKRSLATIKQLVLHNKQASF